MNTDRLLDLTEIAKDLLAKLRFANNREGRALEVGCVPLIFVAHSLGGLIAKKAYLLAKSDPSSSYSEIADATSAFIFFSTPHRGLHRNTINDILLESVAGWRAALNADAVKRSSVRLQDINEKFRDLATPLDIYSFYAHPAADTRYGGLALSPQSTTLDHPCETPIPLETEQSTMTKYSSRHDPDYTSVRGAICLLVEKCQSRRKLPAEEDTATQAAEVDRLLKGCGSPQDDFSFFAERRKLRLMSMGTGAPYDGIIPGQRGTFTSNPVVFRWPRQWKVGHGYLLDRTSSRRVTTLCVLLLSFREPR